MTDVQLFQIVSVLCFMFAVKMKVWRTSLNSFVVFCSAFIVMLGYSAPEFSFVFEHRLYLFSAVLLFMMGRVVYQSIYNKTTKFGRRSEDVL